MNAYTYILKCSDDSYYTGSTKDLITRIRLHQLDGGANYTRERLPVELVYYEEHLRIEDAFNREKQIQNWSRAKKEALIQKNISKLELLSQCRNLSHYQNLKKNF
jgi:putative endonuclease